MAPFPLFSMRWTILLQRQQWTQFKQGDDFSSVFYSTIFHGWVILIGILVLSFNTYISAHNSILKAQSLCIWIWDFRAIDFFYFEIQSFHSGLCFYGFMGLNVAICFTVLWICLLILMDFVCGTNRKHNSFHKLAHYEYINFTNTISLQLAFNETWWWKLNS